MQVLIVGHDGVVLEPACEHIAVSGQSAQAQLGSVGIESATATRDSTSQIIIGKGETDVVLVEAGLHRGMAQISSGVTQVGAHAFVIHIPTLEGITLLGFGGECDVLVVRHTGNLFALSLRAHLSALTLHTAFLSAVVLIGNPQLAGVGRISLGSQIHQSAIILYPVGLLAVLTGEVLIVENTVGMHIEHIVTILLGGGSHVEDEIGIVIAGDAHGAHIHILALTAHEEILMGEGLRLDGLVELHIHLGQRLVFDDLRTVGTCDAHHLESLLGNRHILQHILLAAVLDIVGKVEAVLLQRLVTIAQSPLRLPEVACGYLLIVAPAGDGDESRTAAYGILNVSIGPSILLGSHLQHVVIGIHTGYLTQVGIHSIDFCHCSITEVERVRQVISIVNVIHEPSYERILASLGMRYMQRVYQLVDSHLVEQTEVGVVITGHMSGTHIIVGEVPEQVTFQFPLGKRL